MKNPVAALKHWLEAGPEPLPEHIPEATSDIRKPVRYGLLGLGVTFGACVLWAALAPIDEGVPTAGMVTIDTKRKPVQHLIGGIVDEVLVREAQSVKKGDALIKLNDAVARANYEAARHRYLSLRAMQNRLQAEQLGQDKISFHEDVLTAQGDPLIQQHIETEIQLFTSRRSALKSEMAALDAAIKAQEEAAKGFAAQLVSRKEQRGLVAEERDGIKELVAEGYAPRNKLLELERMNADLGAISSGLQGDYARAKQGSSEMTLKKLQRQQEYRKEVDSQLAEIQRELVADGEKFRATSEELGRTTLRAPADGTVVGLAIQTPGSVIQAGAKVMDIVPQNEVLMLETHIPPHLIDRVRPGQITDIRFSGFAHTPQLVVEGRLISASADLLLDQATNTQYYLARVEVTPDGLKTLGQRQLHPGMPAEVVIKTGERSLLTYLVAPLYKRVAQSMTEE